MLRILLIGLLGAGVALLAGAPDRTALFGALLILLLAFVLAGAKLAVDLVDLIRIDLIADGALLAVLVVAFTRITTGNRMLVGALLALALATQVAPLLLRRARPRHA